MARRKLVPPPPEPLTGYGNGGIHEEKDGSGRWIAELDGMRRRAKSEEEAKAKLCRLQDLRSAQVHLSYGGMRFYAWYKLWITPKYSDLGQKTREGYEEVGRLYIKGFKLAGTILEDVNDDVLEAWLSALRERRIYGLALAGC